MQTLFIVSHTHWDREWYEPFQVFRLRLVRCIDKLLDLLATDPEYKHFLLDGQTVVLEDYLEVRPEREQALRDLVRTGTLQIGPWYILPDEFLVSGEAIIRNLMRGVRIAHDFGKVMQIGYIPDPFGHISQMPQILRGFGFGTAVFRRGLADEPTELWWESPDGTRVLACYLRDGYDNAAWLPRDEAGFIAGIKKLRDSLAPHAITQNLLLMNGTDHMEPWGELSHLMNAAREEINNSRIIHASLPMYVEQVQIEIAQDQKSLRVVRGELRNPKRHHLLPGVASMRMWIKQRNAHAQTLLEKWAEPFVAFAALEIGNWKLDVGTPGTQSLTSNLQPLASNLQLINLAWKYLLQNQPHDSICGCSVDQTHADMVPRFDWVEQIANPIIADSLAVIAHGIGTQAKANAIPLIVFNPVAGPRTDLVTTNVEVPGSLENFVLRDDTGRQVPFQIVSRHVEEYYHAEMESEALGNLIAMRLEERILGMAIQDAFIRADEKPIQLDVTLTTQGEPNFALIEDGLPQIQQAIAQNPSATFDVRAHSPIRFEIEFVAQDVPGYGYRTLYVTPNANGTRSAQPAAAQTITVEQVMPKTLTAIENEFFQVEPNRADGTFTITDKSTRTTYPGMNHFVDGGDRGDLYNYCPPEKDILTTHPSGQRQITVERNAARQSLRIQMRYKLPKGLSDDRTTRTRETVDEGITTTVSLYPGVHRIDFHVQVENSARDHRLRVEFPTQLVSTCANADQAFDCVARSIDGKSQAQDKNVEDSATWVEQPRPEAPMQSFVSVNDDRLGLALATRGLPEYEARQDEDGITLVLTLLRCVGWLSRNDLSTRIGDAGPQKETPGAQEIGTHAFEYALIPHTGNWQNAFAQTHAFTAPMRAVMTSPLAPQQERSLPPAASFVTVSPREFVISAIKLAESGDGLIVRGYNVGDQPIDARIALWRSLKRAARANLNEEEVAPVELHDGCEVKLKARAKEIVTVKFGA